VSFQVWALNRASQLGYETDEQQLNSWNEWATNWKYMVNPDRRDEATKEQTLLQESDTIAQLLLGREHVSASDHAEAPQWVSDYREYLLRGQQSDGSWKAGGQLPTQKRPPRETTEVSSMWALLAVRKSAQHSSSQEGSDDSKVLKATELGLKWLGNKTQGKSTEWWAVRLLLQRELGNDERADELRAKLLGFQRTDGGWGWLVDDKSDALGTGIAIYALAQEGLGTSDESVRKAVGFLAQTQLADGSWDVPGTKKKGRDEMVETASYWGTAWAAIGLMEFTPASKKISARD
jgi:squalene-hopene/tetraprenyl-beta-curcumene cyclase